MDLIEQKKINSTQFKRHPWEIARLKILISLLKKSPAKNLIIDVGSGDAFMATELAKQFPLNKIAAVDINYDEQFIGKNKNANLLFFKNVNDIPAFEPINAVLLLDVLEHIEKPEELLEEIRNLKNITSSTRVIVTVPAYQFLFSEHDIFLKHFKRYNRKQLKRLLHQQGYEIEQSGYFFTGLFFARFFQKLFRIRSKQKVYNWKGSAQFTSIMTGLLWCDFKICWYLSRFGINLPGLSCYCVCHPLPS